MKGFAIYKTDIGYIRIEYENEFITYLKETKNHTDCGLKTQVTDKVYNELCEYFEGKRKIFDFKYILKGTEFQKKVWKVLCNIPYGETRTYKEIATLIGNSKASRAVGMANNKNPIIIAIPCHRVIGSNKKLVGYACGLEIKEYLLQIENKNK